MYDFLICTADRHDPRLLALTVVVCLAASVAAVKLYAYARQTTGSLRPAWLAVAGLGAGSGVWATHFLGLIAHRPLGGAGYDAVLTLLSWALRSPGFAAAFSLAGSTIHVPRRVAYGALVGPAVAVLHYVGVGALKVQGGLSFYPVSVGLAVALGSGLGALAFAILDDEPILPVEDGDARGHGLDRRLQGGIGLVAGVSE